MSVVESISLNTIENRSSFTDWESSRGIAVVQQSTSSLTTATGDNVSHLTYRGNVPDELSNDELYSNIMFQNETSTDFPDGGMRAWLVVMGCFAGMIVVFGVPNSVGAIEAYVNVHQLKDVLNSSVSWVFSTNLAIQFLGGVFFGELFDRYGTVWLLTIATCLIVSGLLLTAELTELYQFVLLYGVLTGLGNSLAQAPLLGAVSHWFLRKRGTAQSIGTIGGLVGGTVFTLALPKMYDTLGYKWAMRILLLVSLVALVIGNLLVRERRLRPVTHSKFKFVPYIKSALDLSIVKDVRFVTMTLATGTLDLISITSLTYLASYAIGMGIPTSGAYLILTIINVCGIPSRLLCGIIADKFGRFNVMIASSILSTIIIFALWLPLNKSSGMLTAFSVLYGICSAVISLIPVCAGQICSSEHFGKVYGTLYFFMAFMALLGIYVSSVIIGNGTPNDYRNFILFEGGLGIASTILWIAARYTVVGFKWCKF